MDQEIEKIIKEQMEKLPIEIRQLFTDPKLGDKIINIGKRNGLNVEQLGILQIETNLVMLGLVHPDEYPNELKNRLKINDMKVDNIINDTNKEILSGILEKLKKIYEKDDEISDDIEEEKFPINAQTVSEPVNISVSTAQTPLQQTPSKIIGEEKVNTTILKSAGIEIIDKSVHNAPESVPSKQEIPPPAVLPTQLMQVEKLELGTTEKPKEEAHPILAQKISGPFQIPMVQTEYSLNNISKATNMEKTENEIKPPVPQAPKIVETQSSLVKSNLPTNIMAKIKPVSPGDTKIPKSYSVNGDPYRLSPEE